MPILTYIKENQSSNLFNPSGTINYDTAIKFPIIGRERGGGDVRNYKIHVVNASISAAIPNIYSTPEYSNHQFNIQLRDSTNTLPILFETIELPTGIYDSRLITLAIKNVINQLNWSNDPDISPIRIEIAPAQQKLIIVINNTLANVPGYDSFALDFTSYPNFATLLGFDSQIYNTTTIASHNAELDLFGNNILIAIEGFGPLSYRNELQSSIIARIPIAERRGNQYYIEGISEAFIDCSPPNELRSLTVRVFGDRQNNIKNKIYLMDGQFSLTIEILPM